MEKILANFLKGLGLDSEFITGKMQDFMNVVDDFNSRLTRMEQRQMRMETMLIRICKKSKIDLSEIYESINDAVPQLKGNDNGQQTETRADADAGNIDG